MKTSISVFLLVCINFVHAQDEKSQLLLDSAKTLFKSERTISMEELQTFDFEHIAHLLEQAVELDPSNAEAHYYLGYVYSRINSRIGSSMNKMNLEMVLKSSEQFEKVIALSPKYEGEIYLLDPYAKISSEWGSMAIYYWYVDKPDSVKWALNEGRKRGGFKEFTLSFCRQVLKQCDKNAILLTSGDKFTFTLLYLQGVEGFRQDVSVIDVNMLGSSWYPRKLAELKLAEFDMPINDLDSLQAVSWSDSVISIEDFSWSVEASYYNQYLLRGDLVLLSLLRANLFKRELYFTVGFNRNYNLSLSDHLSSHILFDHLTPIEPKDLAHNKYCKKAEKYLWLSEKLDVNSQDELRLFDLIRFNILFRIDDYVKSAQTEKAKELMMLYDTHEREQKIPFQQENEQLFLDYLRNKLFE